MTDLEKLIEASVDAVRRMTPAEQDAMAAAQRASLARDPLTGLSDEALLAEYARWDREVREATSWGAALAAADEFRRGCLRAIRRRGLTVPSDPP